MVVVVVKVSAPMPPAAPAARAANIGLATVDIEFISG
jgi:hypothetical protein